MRSRQLKDRVFEGVNALILIVGAFVALVPLLTVIATSFSDRLAVEQQRVYLWPVQFTLDSWRYTLGRPDLWRSFFITVLSTAVGTALALFVTALLSYPLAKSKFKLGTAIMFAIVLTMVFKAPIVPYFLTVRGIGLYNNILVLIIPQVLSAYNVAIMRTFFRQFPQENEEAASIDGCGPFGILFRIVLPSSGAVLATVGLFYGVAIWNQFQHPIMFLQDSSLFPLQLKIRQLLTDGNQLPSLAGSGGATYNDDTLRSAIVVFAILPVIIVYPFLQKHFAKGAMLGSVKG